MEDLRFVFVFDIEESDVGKSDNEGQDGNGTDD